MVYHIQEDKFNFARASKDNYDGQLFDDSDDDSDKLAAVYAGKNVATGDMGELDEERKMPALPTGLPAHVGRKQIKSCSSSMNNKNPELSMKGPKTRKKATQISSGL